MPLPHPSTYHHRLKHAAAATAVVAVARAAAAPLSAQEASTALSGEVRLRSEASLP